MTELWPLSFNAFIPAELQGYFLHARPPPRFHVQLFFECCDPSSDKRPLMVQVMTFDLSIHSDTIVASTGLNVAILLLSYRWSRCLPVSCCSSSSRAVWTTWGAPMNFHLWPLSRLPCPTRLSCCQRTSDARQLRTEWPQSVARH